jgi:transglutaminase-like putative cysteine protease
MLAAWLVVLLCCSACTGNAARLPATGPASADDTLAHVIADVDAGRFAAAEQRIAATLAGVDGNTAMAKALAFERERMRRIRIDFPLRASDVQARLREQVPDYADADFARWDAAGLLEKQVIDGETFYFASAVSNLFRLAPDAAQRRSPDIKPRAVGPLYILHPYHQQLRTESLDTSRNSLGPHRVRVTYTLTVNPDAVPAGETVRAWLPFPRALPGQQEDIHLLDSTPTDARIAPEPTMQRTVYLEQPAQAGMPTTFSIRYEVTLIGQYNAIDPTRVTPLSPTPELAEFTAERPPHIVFTEAMRRFSQQAIGDETNPARIAQRLFEAVDRIPWAVAREYSTLSNIGDYALHAGHADCGQQTLLLMTLLRLNGIPARWQSGWEFFGDSYDSMHDWGWLYLAPYGWVPMDVTRGLFDTPDPALRWFYFGSLDAYRIAFNDDYAREFDPPKQHPRSETVDSQRGEVEWDGGNLYFDQWDYDFAWELLPASVAAPDH